MLVIMKQPILDLPVMILIIHSRKKPSLPVLRTTEILKISINRRDKRKLWVFRHLEA